MGGSPPGVIEGTSAGNPPVRVLQRSSAQPAPEQRQPHHNNQQEQPAPPPPHTAHSLTLTDGTSGAFAQRSARSVEAHLLRPSPTSRSPEATPVIVALGAQGSGKSTVLNHLGNLSHSSRSHPHLSAFPVASSPSASSEAHTTTGLCLRFATCTRAFLLDSPPLSSCSRLADCLQASPSESHPQCDLRLEALQLRELIICLLTCHTLLLCSDGLSDRRMWRLLRLAHTLVPHINGCAEAAYGGPDVILVHTCVNTFSPIHNEHNLELEAQRFFAGSSLAFTNVQEQQQQQLQQQQYLYHSSSGQNRRRTRAHVIPSGSLDDPEVQDAMDRLFNKAHSACTAVKRRAMSEREWLQAFESGWQNIDTSDDFTTFHSATSKRNFRPPPENKGHHQQQQTSPPYHSLEQHKQPQPHQSQNGRHSGNSKPSVVVSTSKKQELQPSSQQHITEQQYRQRQQHRHKVWVKTQGKGSNSDETPDAHYEKKGKIYVRDKEGRG